MIILGGDIDVSTNKITGEFVTENVSLSGDIKTGASATYTGEYEFTPSEQTQTVQIEGKVAKENITINPIPSNYGLITWNGAGSTITVS